MSPFLGCLFPFRNVYHSVSEMKLISRRSGRRTKLERADDLGLPPRTIIVRRDFFSPQEKELYMSLFTNAKRTFNTYLDAGTVLNSMSRSAFRFPPSGWFWFADPCF